jgi:hypothetical protein
LFLQMITWFNRADFVDQPDVVMKPEFPAVDQDRMVSPHAQEIEYALILQRIITNVKENPEQLRLTIYEFARARLKLDTSWAEKGERDRLAAALETAIKGVEDFSARREQKERIQSNPTAQIGQAAPPGALPSTTVETVRPLTPAPEDILVPERVYLRPDFQPVVEVRTQSLGSMLAGFCVGTLLIAVVAALAYKEQLPLFGERFSGLTSPTVTGQAASQSTADTSAQSSAPAVDAKTAAASSRGLLPFPLPSDYGIYALSNGALTELNVLPERVPDKRIAMSTPVTQASRTTVPDGKPRFVLFRRDLVENAPDRVEVRVVARVVRALTFDAKGRPSFSPVRDAWNIRNLAYELRVRPIAGNPEMLLVQSEKADFVLPAGRYVLVLKDRGYDFTVAGNVTDVAQCLERTDAANGEFYSECQKP